MADQKIETLHDMLVFMCQTLFVKYKDLFVCMTCQIHVENPKLSYKTVRVNWPTCWATTAWAIKIHTF